MPKDSKKVSRVEKLVPAPEVRVKWGTFCRSIVQESDSGDTSLLGIMPGLDVEVEGGPNKPADGFHRLMIPMWLNAQFEVKEPISVPSILEFELIISVNNQKPRIPSIRLEVPPNKTFGNLNIRLNHPGGIPLRIGAQELVVKFQRDGKDMGIVSLPISVTELKSDQLKKQ
jgi:hypothetical protein